MGAGERSKIHHLGRPHDVEFHQVDERCGAGQIFDGGTALDLGQLRKHRGGANGRDLARRAVIGKSAHRSALHLGFGLADGGDNVRIRRTTA